MNMLTHIRLHENARKWRKMKLDGYARKVRPARALCGEVVALADTVARPSPRVDCPGCLNALTLVRGQTDKPLTVRRVRTIQARERMVQGLGLTPEQAEQLDEDALKLAWKLKTGEPL